MAHDDEHFPSHAADPESSDRPLQQTQPGDPHQGLRVPARSEPLAEPRGKDGRAEFIAAFHGIVPPPRQSL
jgi:hypothetical protein